MMSTRNLRFRHVAIWRDPFLGGWPWNLGPVTVFLLRGWVFVEGEIMIKMVGGMFHKMIIIGYVF